MTIQTIKNKIHSFFKPNAIGQQAPARQPQESQPASSIKIQELLLHLCSGDQELALWVARWIAYPLRNPGAKMSTALVTRGPRGTGTSLFFEKIVKAIYDQDGKYIFSNQLDTGFNAWVQDAYFVLIDEQNYYPITTDNVATLKDLVSSTSLTLNQKGVPERLIRNEMNFVLLSNKARPSVIKKNDRRFMVIEPPAALSSDFYGIVADEMYLMAGIDAFEDWLLYDLDMGNFNAYTPPYKALPDSSSAKAI